MAGREHLKLERNKQKGIKLKALFAYRRESARRWRQSARLINVVAPVGGGWQRCCVCDGSRSSYSNTNSSSDGIVNMVCTT
jgi:hypothetical protein